MLHSAAQRQGHDLVARFRNSSYRKRACAADSQGEFVPVLTCENGVNARQPIAACGGSTVSCCADASRASCNNRSAPTGVCSRCFGCTLCILRAVLRAGSCGSARVQGRSAECSRSLCKVACMLRINTC